MNGWVGGGHEADPEGGGYMIGVRKVHGGWGQHRKGSMAHSPHAGGVCRVVPAGAALLVMKALHRPVCNTA